MHFRAWDEELSYEETIALCRDLATGHITRITNAEVRDRLQKAVDDHSWSDICNWDIDYNGGLSASDLINVRQALGFYQKLETLQLSVNKTEVARAAFQLSEVKCRETNTAFESWSRGEFLFPRDVERVLHRAQRKIATVLGDVPSLNQLDLTFGPGATSTVPKRNACSRIKLSTVPSCTTNMMPILPGLLREVPHWAALHNCGVSIDEDGWVVEKTTVEISHGRLSFVPKNAKTARSVLTEPTLNALLQAGYGKWIARRLLRVGQDIHDQERNQILARSGSLTGALATLDLSSASDSISIELVAHLLPYDWFVALSECRTPTYIDGDGEPKKLAKFSSMGNGFTFPLQTLIFWALVSSCQERDSDIVSVYGDDIICPTGSVALIKRVFDSVGFTLNLSKSYWDGCFRESCGADYFLGIDIRPFYLKRNISPETLFILHNFYYRRYDSEMADQVLRLIPESLRLFGPDGFGDGHLLGDWSPRPHKRGDGWSGYLFDTYVKLGRKHQRPLPGDRVLPSYSIMLSSEFRVGRRSDDFSFCSLPKARCRKSGVTVETLPGVRGYKRISVYTLTAG